MNWLKQIVQKAIAVKPEGEIIVESGSAPSGPYHVGHLREIITADAIVKGILNAGRQARQIHFVDDFDALRKIPAGISADYQKYLGRPLAEIPAPDGKGSYAEYFLKDFQRSADKLGIKIDWLSGREHYKRGFFNPAIEVVLENVPEIKQILESVSGRKLEDTWSPIQVMEDEYLKKRILVKLDKTNHTIYYLDKDNKQQSTVYDTGKVKLDWRIDWPARWWLLNVTVEPSGRDHATKGGSIDTGMEIQRRIFKTEPPLQIGYDFVNLAGDTKKMSASAGTGIAAGEVLEILPPEIVRYFMLRFPPQKRLFFDPAHVAPLIDEFAKLMETDPSSELLSLSRGGTDPVISRLPFSQLVDSYQAAFKDTSKTLGVLKRTTDEQYINQNQQIIMDELHYIDRWLDKWAPEELKFGLQPNVDVDSFNDQEKAYLAELADKIADAPADTTGEWFHKAIYEIKENHNLQPQQVFTPLYEALVGKDSGPRAGWFLNDLYIQDKDWLIKRLKLEA